MGCLGSKDKTTNNNGANGSDGNKTEGSLAQPTKAATVNMVFAGDPGVGKTSVIIRFKDGIFNETPPATGQGESIKKNIELNGEQIELRIWDTGGQERYTNITSSYYRFADMVVMLYDASNQDSFSHLRNWSEQVDRYCPDTAIKMIVGNKTDLSKVVSVDDAKAFATELGSNFIETSAKTGDKVEDMFKMAAEAVLKHKNQQ